MVTLSVAWVTIPSPNLQGGPCSHPPQSHLGVPGFGIGYVCGGPVPLIPLGACRKKKLETVLGPRGQCLGFPPPPWAWGGVEWGWGGFRVKNCRDVSLSLPPGGWVCTW